MRIWNIKSGLDYVGTSASLTTLSGRALQFSGRIQQLFGHRSKIEPAVQLEGKLAQLAIPILFEFEGAKSTALARLELAQHRFVPMKFRQIHAVLTICHDAFVLTSDQDDGTEVGQAIREHYTG